MARSAMKPLTRCATEPHTGVPRTQARCILPPHKEKSLNQAVKTMDKSGLHSHCMCMGCKPGTVISVLIKRVWVIIQHHKIRVRQSRPAWRKPHFPCYKELTCHHVRCQVHPAVCTLLSSQLKLPKLASTIQVIKTVADQGAVVHTA